MGSLADNPPGKTLCEYLCWSLGGTWLLFASVCSCLRTCLQHHRGGEDELKVARGAVHPHTENRNFSPHFCWVKMCHNGPNRKLTAGFSSFCVCICTKVSECVCVCVCVCPGASIIVQCQYCICESLCPALTASPLIGLQRDVNWQEVDQLITPTPSSPSKPSEVTNMCPFSLSAIAPPLHSSPSAERLH